MFYLSDFARGHSSSASVGAGLPLRLGVSASAYVRSQQIKHIFLLLVGFVHKFIILFPVHIPPRPYSRHE